MAPNSLISGSESFTIIYYYLFLYENRITNRKQHWSRNAFNAIFLKILVVQIISLKKKKESICIFFGHAMQHVAS